MKTVALFGGSFNPVHVAHQMVMLYVLETESVDEIWMVPTHRHVFGKDLAPFVDRVKMCELSAEMFHGKVSVSSVEQELNAPTSRALDTILELKRRHPGVSFRWVIGSDILLETDLWYRWDQVSLEAPPLVIARGGFPQKGAKNEVAIPAISSTGIRKLFKNGESTDGLLSRAVLRYIVDRELYR